MDLHCSLTMRPAILLFLASAARAVEGPQKQTDLSFCVWSPLQSRRDDIYCQARPGWSDKAQRTSHAKPSTPPAATRNASVWDGPSHCIGRFCVFANKQFAKGIVLVTTVENAKRVARLEPMVSGGGAGEQTSHSPPGPPFHTADIPGKGVGVVADRVIRRGETIMAEPPTMLVHRDVLLTDALAAAGDDQPPDRVLGLAVQKLPAPRRRALMRQMGSGISDILLTNTFQVDVGGDETGAGFHLGNYPEVSRFNHDCRPK